MMNKSKQHLVMQNKTCLRTPSCTALHHQAGAVLITSLIFLVLLTILGFSASRGVIMQELISRNLSDQNLALQAAEAALKYAESCIRNSDGLPSGGSNSVASLCVPGVASGVPLFPYADNLLQNAPASFWTTTNGTPYGGSVQGGGSLTLPSGTLSSQPSYVIALMNQSACVTAAATCVYQITSWGTGINANTQRIVQSIFR